MKTNDPKLSNETILQLKRSLSARLQSDGSLRFGLGPPSAIDIVEPPHFLMRLCEIFSTPQSINSAASLLKKDFPNVEPLTINTCIEDLYSMHVLQIPRKISRYDRHELYYDLFGIEPDNYQSLKGKHVGLIGAGGIGSTAAMFLCAAGIGEITLVDDDLLEETNLPRDVLLKESDVGLQKVEAIKRSLIDRNSDVKVNIKTEKIESYESICKYFSECDVWLLSADTPYIKIHEWTNQASLQLKIPYITAGYAEILGLIGPFVVPRITACHNCRILNRESEPIGQQLNLSLQATSYGPLNSIVASIAVNEVIRFLLGLDVKTAGNQLIFNSENYKIETVKNKPSAKCSCGAYGNQN